MSHSPDSLPSDDDRDRQLFLEAIAGREFTLADVIGQSGGDFMKGESPVPKLVQLKTELKRFTSTHLRDLSGSLQAILHQHIDQADEPISRHLAQPLLALEEIIEKFLSHSEILHELVQQVDFKWGQMYDERPYFQNLGTPAHPDDEYSHESVEIQLTDFLAQIRSTTHRAHRA